jgi:hypothetical protein
MSRSLRTAGDSLEISELNDSPREDFSLSNAIIEGLFAVEVNYLLIYI